MVFRGRMLFQEPTMAARACIGQLMCVHGCFSACGWAGRSQTSASLRTILAQCACAQLLAQRTHAQPLSSALSLLHHGRVEPVEQLQFGRGWSSRLGWNYMAGQHTRGWNSRLGLELEVGPQRLGVGLPLLLARGAIWVAALPCGPPRAPASSAKEPQAGKYFYSIHPQLHT